MEIRRIEGILLQHAIEQSKSSQVQKAGEEFRIRVLSTVPNVLLELSSGGGGALKAEVWSSEGNFITLMLKEGLEIKAENKSSLRLLPGDLLELRLEGENLPTFRIIGLSRKNYGEALLGLVLESDEKFYSSISPERLKEDVENSGIFYEKKLLELLLGSLKPEELMKDKKAQLTQTLLTHAKDLSKLLNMEYEQNIEGIKKLFEVLSLKVKEYKSVSSSLKVLLFENLDHKEYMRLVKMFESMGEVELLKAIESKNIPALLKNLWRLTEEGVLPDYRAIFDELRNSQEPAVREFFRLIVESSKEDIREAYKDFLEYLERGRSLLEFYNGKGQQTESLLSRLEFINNLQWLMAKHGGVFYLPVYYEGGKGGLMFKSGREYSVVFKFEYESGFVAGLLKMPKSGGFLDVVFYTDMEGLAEKIRSGRSMLDKMLSEDKIKLRSFSVNLSTKETILDAVRSAYGENFLLLA